MEKKVTKQAGEVLFLLMMESLNQEHWWQTMKNASFSPIVFLIF